MENNIFDASTSIVSVFSLSVAVATACFIYKQYRIQKIDQANRIMLDLIDKYNRVRNDFVEINNEIAALNSEVITCHTKQDFIELYSKIEYNRIREIGYLYEYVGIIAKRGIVDFDIVYDMFSFPLLFWQNTEAIRNCVRTNCKIPDYWKNFEYLYKLYQSKDTQS